jgi:hypothetical protein
MIEDISIEAIAIILQKINNHDPSEIETTGNALIINMINSLYHQGKTQDHQDS